MEITEVCRPNLRCVTVNRAGPMSVLRRKVRCRAIVCGWFCFESVVLKWVLATVRKRPVK